MDKREYAKQWRANNKEYMREYFKKYRKHHPSRLKEARRMVERKREKKQKAVNYLGGRCHRCEQEFPLCCYDFHHKDPTSKDITLGTLLHYKWENIIGELDKCILLCSNCHRIIHNEDYEQKIQRSSSPELDTG